MAEDINSGVQSSVPVEPCLAKVISHIDTQYMGSLEVQLLRSGSGNDSTGSQVQQVRFMSPFWGNTSVDYVTNENDYNNTQKSYGMWFVPPDVGSTVIVIFINGDPARGYWIGCVPDDNMNFMVPGYAATQNTIENITADAAGRTGRAPVAEYNKLDNQKTGDATQFKKPSHPLKSVLETQGLLHDDIRGITTSSARREAPSMVFGISTPGPFDKRANAKTGQVGKADSKVNNVPVSHLGGSSFVMDDGDDKFLRKKPASEAGPSYAAVEQGDKDGDVTIPHNEMIRIRTRTGHQILLHNSEDLIYIGNARGTTWIELTSNGKIDIYAKDSISVHSENDINFTAGRDINFNATQDINLNSTGFYATASTKLNIKSATTNINGSTKLNLSGIIVSDDITGKITCAVQAGKAGAAPPSPGTTVSITSGSPGAADPALIPKRVPQKEPWAYHENLDPVAFTPDKTMAVATSAAASTAPALFGHYTTVTDTFNKVTGQQK